jgi:hypothetical protein
MTATHYFFLLVVVAIGLAIYLIAKREDHGPPSRIESEAKEDDWYKRNREGFRPSINRTVLPSVTNRPVTLSPSVTIKKTVTVIEDDDDPSDEEDTGDDRDDDDGYEQFVERAWKAPGVSIEGLDLSRGALPSGKDFTPVSLVWPDGPNGPVYINGLENTVKKTFAADGRHDWRYGDMPVDPIAFHLIANGIAPVDALEETFYPDSKEAALTPAFDRFATNDRKTLISYVDEFGVLTWRVVSRVVRARDGFTARCHPSRGVRRGFHFDGLRTVFDCETEAEISIEDFIANRRGSSRR